MTVKQLMTAEDLWEMPEIPGKRFELVDGELVEITGTGAVHGPIVELILRAVGWYARERRLGPVLGDGVSYIVARNPDTIRVSDVCFVSRERIPEGGVPQGFRPFTPWATRSRPSPASRSGYDPADTP